MAGKNFKNVDKYWGIWYSVLYGMLEIVGLTLTWDVLKPLELLLSANSNRINFNMGCIETKIAMPALKNILRLTLTWDVLKLSNTENSPGCFKD